jgi:hypothetical protein
MGTSFGDVIGVAGFPFLGGVVGVWWTSLEVFLDEDMMGVVSGLSCLRAAVFGSVVFAVARRAAAGDGWADAIVALVGTVF